jgi:hypothetical protein
VKAVRPIYDHGNYRKSWPNSAVLQIENEAALSEKRAIYFGGLR